MDLSEKQRLLAEIKVNPAQVIGSVSRSYGSQPSDSGAAYVLGVAHFRINQFSIAERNFQTALTNDPADGTAAYYLGLCLERQGIHEEAAKAFWRALAINPGLTRAREKLQALGINTEPVAPIANTPTARANTTELSLPDTEPEFEDYERRVRRKAKIDSQAEKSAELSGLPWWAKFLLAVVIIWIAMGGFESYRASQEQNDMEEVQQQMRDDACQSAREEGIVLPPFC